MRLLARFLCWFGIWHDWQVFPAKPGEDCWARRTCRRCGLWERCDQDEAGYYAEVWRPF